MCLVHFVNIVPGSDQPPLPPILGKLLKLGEHPQTPEITTYSSGPLSSVNGSFLLFRASFKNNLPVRYFMGNENSTDLAP